MNYALTLEEPISPRVSTVVGWRAVLTCAYAESSKTEYASNRFQTLDSGLRVSLVTGTWSR